MLLHQVNVRFIEREKLPFVRDAVYFDGRRLTIDGEELELRWNPVPNPCNQGKHLRLSAVCPRCGLGTYYLMYTDRLISCRRCLVRKPLKN